jgi:hypothetical protein
MRAMTQVDASASPTALSQYFSLRAQLLGQPYALRRLCYRDVVRAGEVLAGGPQAIRIYGMPPWVWHRLGIRIVSRTAVELTRDEQAAFLASAVARTFAENGIAVSAVVDPFLGSGNLLFHLAAKIPTARAVGIENNSEIFCTTRANLRIVRWARWARAIEMVRDDWRAVAGLAGIGPALYAVHPPWGDAFTPAGLDLRETSPPVPAILAALPRPAFALIPMQVRTVPASIDAIEAVAAVLPTLRSGVANIDEALSYRLLALC